MTHQHKEEKTPITIQDLWRKSDERNQEIIQRPFTLKNFLPFILMVISGEIPSQKSPNSHS